MNFEKPPQQPSPEKCLTSLRDDLERTEQIQDSALQRIMGEIGELEDCLLYPNCPNREKYLKDILEVLDQNKSKEGKFTVLPHLIITVRAVALEYCDKDVKSRIQSLLQEYMSHPHENTRIWAHDTIQELRRSME